MTPTELRPSLVMIRPCSTPLTTPAPTPSSDAEPRILHAGHHRDAAGEADHARDRQIEFPHQHRQAEPQRHQAEGREQLHHAEHRADAEEVAGAAINEREHEMAQAMMVNGRIVGDSENLAARASISASRRWCAA